MLAMLLLLSLPGLAYDVLIGVNGNIIAATCTIENRSLSVPMGKISARDLWRTGAVAGKTIFRLYFSQCSEGMTGAIVTFNGEPDDDDDSLLRLKAGGAGGMAIELLDGQGNRIAPNQTGRRFPFLANSSVLEFSAQYRATRDTITPGQADAVSTFSVEYQ